MRTWGRTCPCKPLEDDSELAGEPATLSAPNLPAALSSAAAICVAIQDLSRSLDWKLIRKIFFLAAGQALTGPPSVMGVSLAFGSRTQAI